MVATDSYQHEGTLDLDSAAIERALASLWKEAAGESEGPPVARARVLTLVAYAEDEETGDFAARVMAALPARHPCRGILVRVQPHEDEPLRASVTIQCAVGGGERTICSEQIEVTAGGASRLLLGDAVTPLLVTDLPAVLWWTGRPRPADPVLRRFVRGAADRILLDSALFRDPGAGLIALARWRDDPRRRAAIADLAWERLRGLRLLLAQTMDPPDARAQLRRVTEVRIGHGGVAIPEEGLLLAGWLGASLGWQAMDSPAFGVVSFSHEGRTVTLRFVKEGPEGDERLRSVRLATEDGAVYSVQESALPNLWLCIADAQGRGPIERIVPLGGRSPEDVVLAALGRRGHDPVYEAALSAAAEIAVLGVTA